MKAILLSVVIVSTFFTSACATNQRFVLGQAEYSAWKGDVMYYRKKSVLVNTETGETWGLSYDKKNSTSDGYAWEKIPK